MTPLNYLFAKILDNACRSWQDVIAGGYSEYRIETHCVTWFITARKIDGLWEIKNYTMN